MKQTKQFLRPLLMAIVMMVGMLVPQGAWAEELRVSSGQTMTITRDANYETIFVESGCTLIIEEGVSVSATATGYIHAYGTVINYGTINGIAVYGGATFANHGYADNIFANGGTIYNTGTYVNKPWNNIDDKITPCEHAECTEAEVAATCTHAGGMQTKCDVCHYIKSFVEDENSPALGHSFDSHNGINSCTRCGLATYDAPELKSGYYQIANAGNLYWFADKVNNDYTNFKNANAKLTADIVVNDITFDSNGGDANSQYGPQGGPQEQSNAIAWPGIGNLLRDTNDPEEGSHEEGDDRIKGYEGIFDGQGHTISGLYSSNGAAGLVEVSAGNCIIKNVGIVNSYFHNGTIGVICTVCADNTEISNCYSNAICKGDYIGGIVGILLSNQARIKNCYSTSTLSSWNSYDDRTGGIVGEISIDDGSIPFGEDESTALGANISNCYTTYKQICSNATGTNCEASVPAERFASGEIAYKLNGSVDGEGHWTAGATDDSQAWYQKLGENGDSYPVLAAAEDNTVYYGYENCLSESKTYSNDLRYAEKEDAHDWTEGRCDNCGQECEHEFVQRENDDPTSHVCKICGIDTDHNWDDGKCTVCDYVCEHDWEEYGEYVHKCNICELETDHDWSNGDSKCAVCEYVCQHKVEDDDMWKYGECTICGYECKHKDLNEDDNCDICSIHAETFESLAALIAEDKDYDAVNVTIDEEILMALPHPDSDFSGMYLVALKSGVQLVAPIPEPALNWQSGGRIKGTLKYADWGETDQMLSSKDASFWSNLTYTPAVAKEYNSIDELLADENLENGTLVTVTVNGTITETPRYLDDAKAYQIVIDNGFVLGAIPVDTDPGWKVGGTISGTLQNVTFIRNSEEGEEVVGVMSMTTNIFAPGAGLDYTAPAVTIGGSEIEIALNIQGKYETATPIALTDDAVFTATVDFTATNGVSYTRDPSALTGTNWGTLCVPFELPYNAAEGVTFYTLTSATAEAITLSPVTSGSLAAGTPVLFKRGEGTTSLGISIGSSTQVKHSTATGSASSGLTLTGTYVPTQITDGYYLATDGLVYSAAAYASEHPDSKVQVGAFRAWFAGSLACSAKGMILNVDDDATALEAIDALTSGKAEYYDMQGRKLNEMQRGINIVRYGNGKTVKVNIK